MQKDTKYVVVVVEMQCIASHLIRRTISLHKKSQTSEVTYGTIRNKKTNILYSYLSSRMSELDRKIREIGNRIRENSGTLCIYSASNVLLLALEIPEKVKEIAELPHMEIILQIYNILASLNIPIQAGFLCVGVTAVAAKYGTKNNDEIQRLQQRIETINTN